MTRLCVAATLAGLIAGVARPACAESVSAHWDTYFYAAPGANARVIDEVQREARLDVQGCEAGWCRVRYGEADGYVREEVVHGPGNAVRPDGRPNDVTCFKAAQPGGGAWQEDTFCRSEQ